MNNVICDQLLRACRRVLLCPLVVLQIWTRKGRELLLQRLNDDNYPIGFSRYDSHDSILYIALYWIIFYAITVQGMLFGTVISKWVCTTNFTIISVPLFVAGLDLFHNDKVNSDYELSGAKLAKDILMMLAIIGVIFALPMMILYVVFIAIVLTIGGPMFKYGDRVLSVTTILGFVAGLGSLIYGLGLCVPIAAVIGVYVVLATLLCLFCVIPVCSLIIDKFDIFGDGCIDLFD